MTVRKFGYATVSLLALTLASAAVAQDPPESEQVPEGEQAEDEGRIGDIFVTATRQTTNLQDTPIAITAVTSDELEERGQAMWSRSGW